MRAGTEKDYLFRGSLDFAKQSDTVQDRCRKNAERNVVEMNLPSNHPYLYEINKNVIEEFTVPALLIDLNMNVVAKNLRARRYLRTLRLGNTIRGVVSISRLTIAVLEVITLTA